MSVEAPEDLTTGAYSPRTVNVALTAAVLTQTKKANLPSINSSGDFKIESLLVGPHASQSRINILLIVYWE